jgi:hydrogenase maturation protease
MKKRFVVMGIGNPIMRDDGIALSVARHLKPKMENRDMEVVIGETDVSYCVDSLKEQDFLVVMDAMYTGEEPGRVHRIPLREAAACRRRPFFAHDASVLDAIAAEFPDIRGVIIGIEPAVVGIGFELSNSLKIKFERICGDVERMINEIAEEEKDA